LYYLLRTHGDWTHIWVDAVCINQSDEGEKSQQVRTMDKVYLNAVEVSAWLGLQRPPNWMQWREYVVRTFESSDWFLSDNILEIAERSYWSRMWIVQELVLARRIRVHVSDVNFDFGDLSRQAQTMQKSDAEDLRQLLTHAEARNTDNIDLQHPLHEILLRFKDCRCSDPRDKVFALLSLVNEEDKHSLGCCFPDYSLTHDAVVVITLNYLQDRHGQVITCDSNDLFQSLGASSSRLMRRRLLAASTTLCAFDDLRSVGHADFREIPFHEWEDLVESRPGHEDRWNLPYEDQPDHGQKKRLVRRIAANIWWPLLCCGALWYFGRRFIPL
jgi:hypothetical protein